NRPRPAGLVAIQQRVNGVVFDPVEPDNHVCRREECRLVADQDLRLAIGVGVVMQVVVLDRDAAVGMFDVDRAVGRILAVNLVSLNGGVAGVDGNPVGGTVDVVDDI